MARDDRRMTFIVVPHGGRDLSTRSFEISYRRLRMSAAVAAGGRPRLGGDGGVLGLGGGAGGARARARAADRRRCEQEQARVVQLADALRRLEAQYEQVRQMLGADEPHQRRGLPAARGQRDGAVAGRSDPRTRPPPAPRPPPGEAAGPQPTAQPWRCSASPTSAPRANGAPSRCAWGRRERDLHHRGGDAHRGRHRHRRHGPRRGPDQGDHPRRQGGGAREGGGGRRRHLHPGRRDRRPGHRDPRRGEPAGAAEHLRRGRLRPRPRRAPAARRGRPLQRPDRDDRRTGGRCVCAGGARSGQPAPPRCRPFSTDVLHSPASAGRQPFDPFCHFHRILPHVFHGSFPQPVDFLPACPCGWTSSASTWTSTCGSARCPITRRRSNGLQVENWGEVRADRGGGGRGAGHHRRGGRQGRGPAPACTTASSGTGTSR